MQQNCDLRTFNHQNPPQLMTFSVPRFCSSEGRMKLLHYGSMLVMVSSTKGIAHAVINVNAVMSSHFLWIILGKTGLELLKRGFFFFSLFVCLAYSFCILLLVLLLWNMFAICEKNNATWFHKRPVPFGKGFTYST